MILFFTGVVVGVLLTAVFNVRSRAKHSDINSAELIKTLDKVARNSK